MKNLFKILVGVMILIGSAEINAYTTASWWHCQPNELPYLMYVGNYKQLVRCYDFNRFYHKQDRVYIKDTSSNVLLFGGTKSIREMPYWRYNGRKNPKGDTSFVQTDYILMNRLPNGKFDYTNRMPKNKASCEWFLNRELKLSEERMSKINTGTKVKWYDSIFSYTHKYYFDSVNTKIKTDLFWKKPDYKLVSYFNVHDSILTYCMDKDINDSNEFIYNTVNKFYNAQFEGYLYDLSKAGYILIPTNIIFKFVPSSETTSINKPTNNYKQILKHFSVNGRKF